MDDRHQEQNTEEADREGKPAYGKGGGALELDGQIGDLLGAHPEVHHTTEDAVGAQGKDERGDLHHRDAPAVDKAHHGADENTDGESERPALAILEHSAHHGGHQNSRQVHRHLLPGDLGL